MTSRPARREPLAPADPEPGADEQLRRLRSTLRDLLALTTLPALWVGRDVDSILPGLLDVLISMLRVDVAYARLATGDQTLTAAISRSRTDVTSDAAAVGRALESAIQQPGLTPGVPAPDGDGSLDVWTVPFGIADGQGLLTLGARRRGFPSESERLLIEVAANQALIAVQSADFAAQSRARAEALRESERVRLTLLSNLPGVAYRCRAAEGWAVEYLSDGVSALTGWPAADFIGSAAPRKLARLVHADDHAAVWQRIRSALDERQPYDNVFRMTGAGGETKWIWNRGQGVFDSDGTPVALEGFITDITARQLAETRLREQTEALETLNRISRLLSAQLDLEPLVQAVTDAGTRLTHAAYGAFFYNVVNERSESYTLYALAGASREAFAQFPMPRNTEVFGPTFGGAGPVRVDDILLDPRYGRNPPHSGMPPGHLPVRSYLAVPVVSRSAEVLGGLFFGHPDAGIFTERDERTAVALAAQTAVAMDNARLYEKEQRARALAEAANRTKDEFLATLSHELRTPLAAVLGWTAMLRSGSLDSAMRDRAQQAIERNARMQAQLVEDLLDVSRIVTGKLRLDTRPTTLAGVVEAAVDAVRPAAQARRQTLALTLARDATAMGDAARLQQVFWNLLSNAVKFTPEGGQIDVALRGARDSVQIEVRDSGVGIPADVLPHVFERFRQADSSSTRHYGGLGIGLALARHLVELHGGTISAQSDGLGHGATFCVTLPTAGTTAAETNAVRPTPETSTTLSGLSILIVDDDLDTRELFAAFLARLGATVRVAVSAREAVAEFTVAAPDVILCDIEMPDADGYAVLRSIRALDAARGRITPAIAVTAYGSIDDRLRALAAGFQMHIAKPVEPTELGLVIASVAGRIR